MRMKKGLQLVLAVVLCGTMFFSMPDISLGDEDKDRIDVVEITSMEDWEELIEQDELEYQEMIASIDSELLADIRSCIDQLGAIVLNEDGMVTDYQMIEIKEFLNFYPEYTEMDPEELTESITLATDNAVAEAVKDYFSDKGYLLSLELFKHSLASDPQDLYLDLDAATDSFRTYIKGLLNDEESMVEEVVKYLNGGTKPVGHVFSEGDLHYAINKCDLAVVDITSTSAAFLIQDTYDFSFPDTLVTKPAGCNEFYFEILGVVSDGRVK